MNTAQGAAKNIANTNPYDTPSLPVRMACWVYEGLMMFAVSFTFGYLFSSLVQARHGLSHRLGLMAFLFVVFGIYFVYFWHKGQTLPMKTWRIRVLSMAGQPLTQSRAALRYVLAWLWLLPPLLLASLVAISSLNVMVLLVGWLFFYALLARLLPGKQFLHDVLAGTQLVRSDPLTQKGLV